MVQHDIPVGLVLECLAPGSQWGEPIWLPVQVLDGVPDTPPWTVLAKLPDRTRYFAGGHVVTLYGSETGFYRDNLASGSPKLWIAMRPQGSRPPVEILAVTADPTEGEGYTQTGTNVVEVIEMPERIAAEIAAFVAEHHVERTFEKRQRDNRPSGKLSRRRPIEDGR